MLYLGGCVILPEYLWGGFWPSVDLSFYNPVARSCCVRFEVVVVYKTFQEEDTMLGSHRILRSVPVVMLAAIVLSCGSAHDSDEYFVFVSSNLQVPYWKTAGAGFSNAAGQFKVRSDSTGPQ